jgi:hypothetical protein
MPLDHLGNAAAWAVDVENAADIIDRHRLTY